MPDSRVAHFDAVQRGRSRRTRRDRSRRCSTKGCRLMALLRHHHVLGRVSLEAGDRLRVGLRSPSSTMLFECDDAGGGAEEHRRVEALAQLVGELDELLAPRRCRRAPAAAPWRTWRSCGCPARSASCACRGRRPDHHQAALHAGVGGGEERVGRHVDADVLHAHQRAGAGHGRADGHFHGHLLVWRPLAVDVLVARAALRVSRCWACRDRRRRSATPASQAPRAMASLPDRIVDVALDGGASGLPFSASSDVLERCGSSE